MLEQKRGKNIALIGTVLHLVFAVVMLIVAMRTGSGAAMVAMMMFAVGMTLWLMTAVLFYCHQLERREQGEFEELARQAGAAGTIFGDEQADAHRNAQARVAFVHRWIVPIFTVFWFVANLAFLGFGGLLAARRWGRIPTNVASSSLIVMLVGFLGFLFSAYVIGMSRQKAWRSLRWTKSNWPIRYVWSTRTPWSRSSCRRVGLSKVKGKTSRED